MPKALNRDGAVQPQHRPNPGSALDEYCEKYGHSVTQESERLFVREFLYLCVVYRDDCVVAGKGV